MLSFPKNEAYVQGCYSGKNITWVANNFMIKFKTHSTEENTSLEQ